MLVVEPEGAVWSPSDARTSAKVTVAASGGKPAYSFQEFVIALQDQTGRDGDAGRQLQGRADDPALHRRNPIL